MIRIGLPQRFDRHKDTRRMTNTQTRHLYKYRMQDNVSASNRRSQVNRMKLLSSAALLCAAATTTIRAGVDPLQPATQPSMSTEPASADAINAENVRLRMELQDLRNQNTQLRRQLAAKMQHAYSTQGNIMPQVQTRSETETSQAAPPSSWQLRRFNNDTYYLIPLCAHTTVIVSK